MKRIRVHSVEQYVQEIGPLMKQGLETYRADDPEQRLLGIGFTGADTEVLISIQEFIATGNLVKYGELIEPYEPEGKKTQKVKGEKADKPEKKAPPADKTQNPQDPGQNKLIT